jgi:hypothetical protein
MEKGLGCPDICEHSKFEEMVDGFENETPLVFWNKKKFILSPKK